MRILMFGGTTEGRLLSRDLARDGAEVTVCVATDYGREEQGEAPGVTVLVGRKGRTEMERILPGYDLCVDATHPYATEVTANLRQACAVTGIRYCRLLREESEHVQGATYWESAKQAAEYLSGTTGNVLLAIGAKELMVFSGLPGERLYPRVLPQCENLQVCENAGIPHRNIIAMQGPFCRELNEALIRQCHICYLVTKDGGSTGGFPEKVEAARNTGAELVIIRRPEDHGRSYAQVRQLCKEMMEWSN